MTRNFKILGLAFAAVLAMNAVAASGASAAAPEVHCTATVQTSCWLTSTSSDHIFMVGQGEHTANVTCESAKFTSTVTKTSTSQTITPVYTKCKAFGLAAPVAMNGCTYTLNDVAASSPATATVDVVCPAGKVITIKPTGLACVIEVGAQAGLKHVIAENKGIEPTHVFLNITVGSISAKTNGSECPTPGVTHLDGTYTGTATIEGFEDEGGTIAEPKEGNKVGVHVF
jgi:hypothetical protein